MKKAFIVTAVLAACVQLYAQPAVTSEEYQAKYDRQVRNVGFGGVGVETILDKWEADYPDALEPKIGRANYYYAKSQSTGMITLSEPRYLGTKPVLTLKDDDGNDVNYFQDITYDDEYFSQCQTLLDDYMREDPDELRYRFIKISSLLAYEKGDPVLTEAEMNKLIDQNKKAWCLDGQPTDEATFIDAVQELCFSIYAVGTPACYEAFLRLSTRMNKLYPKNTAFIDNIGSYWLVHGKNYKKAISYYKKALKIDPEDVAAIRNMKLAERESKK